MSTIMLWVPKYQQWMSLEEISYRRMINKDVPQEHLKVSRAPRNAADLPGEAP